MVGSFNTPLLNISQLRTNWHKNKTTSKAEEIEKLYVKKNIEILFFKVFVLFYLFILERESGGEGQKEERKILSRLHAQYGARHGA